MRATKSEAASCRMVANGGYWKMNRSRRDTGKSATPVLACIVMSSSVISACGAWRRTRVSACAARHVLAQGRDAFEELGAQHVVFDLDVELVLEGGDQPENRHGIEAEALVEQRDVVGNGGGCQVEPDRVDDAPLDARREWFLLARRHCSRPRLIERACAPVARSILHEPEGNSSIESSRAVRMAVILGHACRVTHPCRGERSAASRPLWRPAWG